MKTFGMMLSIMLGASVCAAQTRTGSGGRPVDSPLETREQRLEANVPLAGNRIGADSIIYFSGDLIEMDTSLMTIRIREKRNGKEIGFDLAIDCKLRADKKEFGKKELSLHELQQGYRVELSVNRFIRKVVEMRVKKAKEASQQGKQGDTK